MSILSNIEIEKLIKTSNLIENGHESQIGAACYELRAGTTYFDLTENNIRIDVSWNGSIIIKPWHRVVI
ncbi:hypothetical protein, partial [Pseudomonas umsongensis]|uniref:hypothetical protein n=1 Tax=Pseudomonas umsongensis TaxID=198618 RepID=UPI00200A4856